MGDKRLSTGWLTVAQYADRRGVTKQAIYRQIKRRKSVLDGLTEDVEGTLYLSPEAMEKLDAFRSHSPAVVVQDGQAAEIDRLRAEVERLQQELDNDRVALRGATEQMAKLMEVSAEQARLEAREKLLIEEKEQAAEEVNRLNKQLTDERTAREAAEAAKREAEEELARIRSRGLWARIINV